MPGAARLGDMDSGCPGHSPAAVTEGSPDVFINGKPAARTGDAHGIHSGPSGHAAFCGQGSATVFINGRAAFRIGDPVDGATQVQGSPDVIIGG